MNIYNQAVKLARKRMLIAASPYRINWTIPYFKEEVGEYFENQYTIGKFKERGLVFNSNEELINFLKKGALKSISNLTNVENITLTEKDFKNEMINPNYKKAIRRC